MTEFIFCLVVWAMVFVIAGFLIGYVYGRIKERRGWKELVERLGE